MGGNVEYYINAEQKAEYEKLRMIILDYLYRNNKEIVIIPNDTTEAGQEESEKLYNDQWYLLQNSKYYDDYRSRRKSYIEGR